MCECDLNLTKMQSKKQPEPTKEVAAAWMVLEKIQTGRESSNFGQNAGLKQI